MSASIKDQYPEHRRYWQAALFPELLDGRGVFQGEPKVYDCPSASLPTEFPPPLGYADYGYNQWGLGGFITKPLLGMGGKGPGPTMVGSLIEAAYAPPGC